MNEKSVSPLRSIEVMQVYNNEADLNNLNQKMRIALNEVTIDPEQKVVFKIPSEVNSPLFRKRLKTSPQLNNLMSSTCSFTLNNRNKEYLREKSLTQTLIDQSNKLNN